MDTINALVIAPFRRAIFRNSISSLYPFIEPMDSPPLIVAGDLEKNGLKVQYLPLIHLFNGYNDEVDRARLTELLGQYHTEFLIFNVDNFIPSRSTATIYGINLVTEIMKHINPNILIGVSGRISTVLKSKLYEFSPNIDFSIVGEPEEVIGSLVAHIKNNGLESANESFPFLLIKEDLNKNTIPSMVEDLENIALPAYHLLKPIFVDYEYHTGIRPYNIPFSIRTSLGCKFQCKFCSGVPNWLNYRLKSALRVEREIKYMKEVLGDIANLTFLEDEIFTKDIDHVRDIVKIFKDNKIFLEGLYTHSTLLNEEIVSLLSNVTNRVYMGLDNASDEVLKKMGKGQKVDTVLNSVELAHKRGLKVHLEWIIGTPEENVDSLINSLSTIFNLLSTGVVDSINTYVYCPHPGTAYAENPTKYDLKIVDSLDYMQESGGYPTYRTKDLTQNQIFTAYLMSQLVIKEAIHARGLYGRMNTIRESNYFELKELFEKIGNNIPFESI